jgi:hypothetical protein
MAKRIPKAKKVPLAGKRVGAKRSDLRWEAEGEIWASPFEYKVYDHLRANGRTIRRADERDKLTYNTPVKQGRCTQCNSCSIVQERTYTPDLVVVQGERREEAIGRVYFIETKGYFDGPKRNLFRQVKSQHTSIDLRLLASSDHWVTKGKTRLSDWAKRFKIPFALWKDGMPLPEGW